MPKVSWRALLGTVCRDLHGLRRVPRGMWVIFLLKCMESFAYFSMGINMALYFSDEHGMSDVEAGTLYGLFGVLISVYGLLGGFLIDRLGVRRSLVLGSALSAVGRLTFALCRTRGVLLLATTVLMPAGNSPVAARNSPVTVLNSPVIARGSNCS